MFLESNFVATCVKSFKWHSLLQQDSVMAENKNKASNSKM